VFVEDKLDDASIDKLNTLEDRESFNSLRCGFSRRKARRG
jgi:hypothetical protein